MNVSLENQEKKNRQVEIVSLLLVILSFCIVIIVYHEIMD